VKRRERAKLARLLGVDWQLLKGIKHWQWRNSPKQIEINRRLTLTSGSKSR
jgi:hypothetical protein